MPPTSKEVSSATSIFRDLAWRSYVIICYAKGDETSWHSGDWSDSQLVPSGPKDLDACCQRHIEALKPLMPAAREAMRAVEDSIQPLAPSAKFSQSGLTMHHAVLMTAEFILGDKRPSWKVRKSMLARLPTPDIAAAEMQLWNELNNARKLTKRPMKKPRGGQRRYSEAEVKRVTEAWDTRRYKTNYDLAIALGEGWTRSKVEKIRDAVRHRQKKTPTE